MYTEDDEKVTVKKDNSSADYNDFYTSFNETEEKGKKDKSKKDKKKEKDSKKESKKEEKYSNFYDVDETDNEVKDEDNGSKKKIIIIIGGIILLLVLVFAIIFIINKLSNKGDIELDKNEITLKAGEEEFISYRIVNTDKEVTSKFTSSKPEVATVDENGKITAISGGESTITIVYSIGGSTKEKTVKVMVPSDPTSTPAPIVTNLNLRFSSGGDNKWTNKDVTLTVDVSSNATIASVKYALDCSGECKYEDVKDSKITITKSGITKVKVVVKDSENKEVTKEVTVKIDKEAPIINYDGRKEINSNTDVEVCATCSDSLSGCKNNKVCKKYTSSKNNEAITVTDNAGNTTKSTTFNVVIIKKQDPCVLKVSQDGTVTATLRESAKYYGFNSNYSGENELSKKVSINASKAGESGALVVRYYVLNNNGSGGMCYVTVIKECSCNDKNSTDPKCPTTCTFRAS